MALTVGSCAPIVPYASTTGSGPTMQPTYTAANTSQTFSIGDIVIICSNKASKDSTVPTATGVEDWLKA